MNMTPLERKNSLALDLANAETVHMPKAGDPDFATTAANFFSKDLNTNQTKARALNKKRK